MFGVVFPGLSPALDMSVFIPVDPTHWVMDLAPFVGDAYEAVSEAVLFMTAANVIPSNDMVLALYVRSPGTPWEYRGAIFNQRPSAVISLHWPDRIPEAALAALEANAGPGAPISPHAQIGISVEPRQAAELQQMAAPDTRKETFAKSVAMDLFRYLESFASQVPQVGDNLVVPTNILDRWFTRFQDKFRRDPEFLTRAEQI
eukprot:jgi/Chlat1/4415/Chrsp29S04545